MSAHSLSTEHELIADYQAGDILAGAALLRLYEGLINTIVRHYVTDRCELEDLLQIGRMALLHAAKRHDVKLGRLSTFAFSFVKWEAADYARPLRFVVHVSEGMQSRTPPHRPVCLDAPLPSGNGTYADVLAAPVPEEPEATVDASALLGALPERQQMVMRRLYSEEPETLECIGESMGVTKERVRQIKEKALARMRRAARSRPWAQ